MTCIGNPMKNNQGGNEPTRRLWSGITMKMTEKLHAQGTEEDPKGCSWVSEHYLGAGGKDKCSMLGCIKNQVILKSPHVFI